MDNDEASELRTSLIGKLMEVVPETQPDGRPPGARSREQPFAWSSWVTSPSRS